MFIIVLFYVEKELFKIKSKWSLQERVQWIQKNAQKKGRNIQVEIE